MIYVCSFYKRRDNDVCLIWIDEVKVYVYLKYMEGDGGSWNNFCSMEGEIIMFIFDL